MWIEFTSFGASLYIKDSNVIKVHINDESTWLCVTNSVGKDIIITTSDMSSNDVIGYPYIFNVGKKEDVEKAFNELSNILKLSESSTINL